MGPKFVNIRQHYPAEKLQDVVQAVRETVAAVGLAEDALQGAQVGIAVGSRGITNIPLIVKTVVEEVRRRGGTPTIFPAMGSHGNGCAEGQREVLESLGVTEESTGCPIRTSGESVFCGETEQGLKVYVNRIAFEFDKIIVINRVKPHTDFEDITESGLFKLMAIGMGNPEGAKNIHARSLAVGYGAAIRDAGNYIMAHLPIVMGLAITENWKQETDSVEAILPQNLLEAESRILAQVKAKSASIPVDEFDTLIVKEAGKNISGTCVDTKVIGRIMVAGQKEPERPRIRTITALDFTEESHGNAMGMGVVDLITRRAFSKIDIEATALTGMTSTCLLQARMPCVAPNDEMAITTAYRAAGVADPETVRAVMILHTNALECMAVTENLYDTLKDRENIEKISEPYELTFDAEGNLLTKLPNEN